jgi:DNA-binding transcriptional ArsR family regulator
LRILEDSGLVRSNKTGRVRTYKLAPKRLKAAEDWLSRQRSLWERRLDQLDSYLLELKEKGS